MDNRELLGLAHSGDRDARDSLIQNNIGLVWNIARRFAGRGYDAEDIFQIGCIGLIKAVDKFDASYDVQFSTYAVPLIMGEIKRFIRDDGMVKVSRTVKENGWKIKRIIQQLSQKLGREPTIEEISRETSLNKEDIAFALEATGEVESIYKSSYQSDGSEVYLIDRISVDNSESGSVDKIINNMALEQILNELGEVEREIIIMRYFQEKTQTEIASRLGISQVQVSRLEKKILLTMRKKM